MSAGQCTAAVTIKTRGLGLTVCSIDMELEELLATEFFSTTSASEVLLGVHSLKMPAQALRAGSLIVAALAWMFVRC